MKACFLLCRRAIDVDQLSDADTFLNAFCVKFSELYGKGNCTINMRHLQEYIKDYGPVYSFWCFAIERMNGILGSYHTNYHNISIQLARHFLKFMLHTNGHKNLSVNTYLCYRNLSITRDHLSRVTSQLVP